MACPRIQTRHAPTAPRNHLTTICMRLPMRSALESLGALGSWPPKGLTAILNTQNLPRAPGCFAAPIVRPARRPHTAAIQANRAWLKTHRQDYAGQWVALRDGHLLAAAPSFDQLVAHVDETHDVLMTKLPA